MGADEQEIERVAIVSKDDSLVKSDAELVETASEFAQSQMRVRFPERFNQGRDGVEHLVLDGRR